MGEGATGIGNVATQPLVTSLLFQYGPRALGLLSTVLLVKAAAARRLPAPIQGRLTPPQPELRLRSGLEHVLIRVGELKELGDHPSFEALDTAVLDARKELSSDASPDTMVAELRKTLESITEQTMAEGRFDPAPKIKVPLSDLIATLRDVVEKPDNLLDLITALEAVQVALPEGKQTWDSINEKFSRWIRPFLALYDLIHNRNCFTAPPLERVHYRLATVAKVSFERYRSDELKAIRKALKDQDRPVTDDTIKPLIERARALGAAFEADTRRLRPPGDDAATWETWLTSGNTNYATALQPFVLAVGEATEDEKAAIAAFRNLLTTPMVQQGAPASEKGIDWSFAGGTLALVGAALVGFMAPRSS